jgi:hypothetical protein
VIFILKNKYLGICMMQLCSTTSTVANIHVNVTYKASINNFLGGIFVYI